MPPRPLRLDERGYNLRECFSTGEGSRVGKRGSDKKEKKSQRGLFMSEVQIRTLVNQMEAKLRPDWESEKNKQEVEFRIRSRCVSGHIYF